MAAIESTEQMLALDSGSLRRCRRGQGDRERIAAQNRERWTASNPGQGAAPMPGRAAAHSVPVKHLAIFLRRRPRGTYPLHHIYRREPSLGHPFVTFNRDFTTFQQQGVSMCSNWPAWLAGSQSNWGSLTPVGRDLRSNLLIWRRYGTHGESRQTQSSRFSP
jgi:hypothetical protein